MKTNKNQSLPLLCALIAVLLPACASFSFKPPEAALRDRVNAYMTAKVNNDWRAVYRYLSPAYRETVSENDFAAKVRKIRFLSYSIESIQMLPSGAEATVELKYNINMQDFVFENNKTKETWIKKGGKWYLEMKESPDKGLFR